MNNNRAEEQIEKRNENAKRILESEEESERLANNAENKFRNAIKNKKSFFFQDRIEDLKEYLPLLISLFRSYTKKEYTEIPVMSIVSIVAALIYFFSPADLIPDFIPGFGYIDDAGVIMFLVYSLKNDLNKYKKWKTTRDNIIDVEPQDIKEDTQE